MPYKDKEKKKEYNKKYHQEYYKKNKEKVEEQKKEWRENNKEKVKEYNKQYRKEYYQTEAGKKSNRIGSWKQNGIISDDYNSLYEYYLSVKNCEECNVELVEGIKGNFRCLDHDHETGLFRNVLCNSCNLKRGH